MGRYIFDFFDYCQRTFNYLISLFSFLFSPFFLFFLFFSFLSLRFFKKPIHNDLVELVLKRVKCMLGYPESKPDMINPNSVLYRYVLNKCDMTVYLLFSCFFFFLFCSSFSSVLIWNCIFLHFCSFLFLMFVVYVCVCVRVCVCVYVYVSKCACMCFCLCFPDKLILQHFL